jgi:type I restriction enzyme S subunit
LFHALAYAEPNWKRLEQGSTFTSANSTQVSAFSMLIPARLDEQAAIAEVLTDMDEELSLLGKRLKKTRNIKQAMMQELLTGKTRLV